MEFIDPHWELRFYRDIYIAMCAGTWGHRGIYAI